VKQDDTGCRGRGFPGATFPGLAIVTARAFGAAVTVALGLVLGCAYSFSGSNLPSYIKTIAVPNFANETLQPGLDQEFTTAVIDRYIKDGRLKLAPEGKESCRLSGRVTKYENRVYNYTADQSPRDYIVVVTASVVLKDMVKNRDLWKDDALTRTAVYVPGASSGLSNETDARADAIRQLATDMVTRTMEPW
jgi:hypothetical protein